MADRSRPPPMFLPGQFVKYRCHQDAMVDEVLNSGLGYNLYKITFLQDGSTMRVASHTLSKCENLTAEFGEELEISDEDINIVISQAEKRLMAEGNIELEAEEEPPEKKSRFPELTEADVDSLAGQRIAETTVKATKYGVKVFQDWLQAREKSFSFEGLPRTALASLLHGFYAEVRNTEGKRYGHSTIRGIRASINRHIRMPPYNRKIDIMSDNDFIQANFVFDGYVKMNIKDGNAKLALVVKQ